MRFTVFWTCTILLVTVFADDIQDEIAAAREKYCSGIEISQPVRDQVFTDPTQVLVTVERDPELEPKIINGVDVYTIEDGQPIYLGTPWKGAYTLDTAATLTVDVTKTPNIELPSQLEFRVWVRNNEKGPDCTLTSAVFRVQSLEHNNEAFTAMKRMSRDVDRGCFGVAIAKPAFGEHVSTSDPIQVNIRNDPLSQMRHFQSLDLYQFNTETGETRHVQKPWQGQEMSQQLFNIKYQLENPGIHGVSSPKYTYFYKFTGETQNQEVCQFQSHPFYFVN